MDILAHGLGRADDLPIPMELAIAGAVAALTISFTVLAVAWRTPRYDDATSGRAAEPLFARVVDSTAFGVAARTLGFAIFAFSAMCAVLGEDRLTNPIFGIFYVWWWVGLVPLSLLFGPVYRAISPVRTINAAFAKLSGTDPEKGVFTYPERLGYWPAAIGLFAFVWLELVYPYSTELGPVRLWCAAYVAVMLVGGALFGTVFYERGDPFEVYSTLVGKLSIFGRRPVEGDPDGRGQLVIRSPLANLDTVVVRPGLVAVVAVLFGSTAFDSFKGSTTWIQFIQGSESIRNSSYLADVANNLALLGFCAGIALVFSIGTMLTPVAPGTRRLELPNQFAHSIVPIIVGYIAAHYLTYLVEFGQQTFIYASNPLSAEGGADWFGTSDWKVNFWFTYHPTLLASIKVLSVIIGHVVAVVAAHERAVELLPKKSQLVGQLPLLFAMIGFTVGGLWLLFST